MKNIFRKKHTINILEEFKKSYLPLDLFLSNYFRKNKSIGSKDRKIICEKIYKIIKHLALINYFIEKPITSQKQFLVVKDLEPTKHLTNTAIPEHIRVSFPKPYFEKIKNSYPEKAIEICSVLNTKAPVTIRVNTLKISTKEFINKLEKKYNISPCVESKNGITFREKTNFFAMEEFKNGFFEIQDEGSQLIADLIEPNPTDKVLDFCAGSAGKTLAFAHKIPKKGIIYIHDIRENALIQAKKRLKRAGIENYQIIKTKNLKKLTNKLDWILLDVPCSGSGTLRRNPDMKWKFNLTSLTSLIETQKEIFKQALPLLKNGGYIVYATCSIFNEENQDQIEYFLNNYSLEKIKTISFLPKKEQKDGFFGSILQKK